MIGICAFLETVDKNGATSLGLLREKCKQLMNLYGNKKTESNVKYSEDQMKIIKNDSLLKELSEIRSHSRYTLIKEVIAVCKNRGTEGKIE